MPEPTREMKVAGAEDVDLYIRINAVEHPKAAVVMVHGLAEHSGRYDYVVSKLNLMGYTVYRFDLRGHGKSGGERGYVNDFHYFIEDTDLIIQVAQKENPDLPLFMLGHSMGGFITAAYGVKYPNKLKGQILSAAAVALQPTVEPLRELDFDSVAHEIVPNSLDEEICRDPQVRKAYADDPLVLKEFRLNLVGEVLIKGAMWITEKMPTYQYPCLILHGSGDRIVTPDTSRYMYEHIGSNDKTLRTYDGLFHEILNEPERDQVLEDIFKWLAEKVR